MVDALLAGQLQLLQLLLREYPRALGFGHDQLVGEQRQLGQQPFRNGPALALDQGAGGRMMLLAKFQFTPRQRDLRIVAGQFGLVRGIALFDLLGQRALVLDQLAQPSIGVAHAVAANLKQRVAGLDNLSCAHVHAGQASGDTRLHRRCAIDRFDDEGRNHGFRQLEGDRKDRRRKRQREHQPAGPARRPGGRIDRQQATGLIERTVLARRGCAHADGPNCWLDR